MLNRFTCDAIKSLTHVLADAVFLEALAVAATGEVQSHPVQIAAGELQTEVGAIFGAVQSHLKQL